MRTKIVLWGANEKDEKLLLGIELIEKDNKIKIYIFPAESVTEEFYAQMMNQWRNGSEVPFPEDHATIERDLSIIDSILPDDIKVEKTDIINRAKTEWHFVVLSRRLQDSYRSEIEDFKAKIKELSSYDSGLWEDLKGFWNKVQAQVREKNLFRDHSDTLRRETNEVFETLKSMRKSFDDTFKKTSKENMHHFMEMIDKLEQKIDKGMGLQPIFNELKNIQKSFKDVKFTREDRNKVWQKIDKAFKDVKEKKYGSKEGNTNSAKERIERRHKGLMSAITRMETSINRDKRDLDFQTTRVENTEGQLEQQIRQAKISMIKERVSSKEVKLKDMLNTKLDLENRLTKEKEKEARREKARLLEEEKKKIKDKISEDIKKASEDRSENDEKLKKAAESIKGNKQKKQKPPIPPVELPSDDEPSPKNKAEEDSIVEVIEPIEPNEKEIEETVNESKDIDAIINDISDTVGDTLTDAIDTTRAIASVLGSKLEETLGQLIGDSEEE